jgi:hypothetical protein
MREQERSLLRDQPLDPPRRLAHLDDEPGGVIGQVAPVRQLIAAMFQADGVLVGRAGRPNLDTTRPPGFQEIGAHVAQAEVAPFGKQRFKDVAITVLAGGR